MGPDKCRFAGLRVDFSSKKKSLAGAVKGLNPCLVNFDLFQLKGIMSLPRLFLKVYLIVHYTLSMVLAGKAEFCYN